MSASIARRRRRPPDSAPARDANRRLSNRQGREGHGAYACSYTRSRAVSITPDRNDSRPSVEPPGIAAGSPSPDSQGAAAALPVSDAPTVRNPVVNPRVTANARREPAPAQLSAVEFEAAIEALVRAGSPGAVLRQARLMRRLSIADVASTTRIRSEYVAAMEDGTAGVLPPGRYGLSLYRSYAIFLGVPPDDIVRMHDRESGRRSRSVGIFGAKVSVQSSRRLVAIAVVAVALTVAGALWYFLQPLSAAEIEAATTRVLAQATFLPGIAPAATRSAAPPTMSLSSLASTPVPTPVPVPTSVPKPTTAPTPIASVTETLATTPIAEPEEEPEPEPVDPTVVSLTFVEDSWIRISVDGKQVFEGIVRSPDTRTYAGDIVTVVAGNGSGVELVAYGDRIGVVGKRNEVFEGVYRRPSR
jgi:cytoskeleton protein RodZ